MIIKTSYVHRWIVLDFEIQSTTPLEGASFGVYSIKEEEDVETEVLEYIGTLNSYASMTYHKSKLSFRIRAERYVIKIGGEEFPVEIGPGPWLFENELFFQNIDGIPSALMPPLASVTGGMYTFSDSLLDSFSYRQALLSNSIVIKQTTLHGQNYLRVFKRQHTLDYRRQFILGLKGVDTKEWLSETTIPKNVFQEWKGFLDLDLLGIEELQEAPA